MPNLEAPTSQKVDELVRLYQEADEEMPEFEGAISADLKARIEEGDIAESVSSLVADRLGLSETD